MRSRPDVTLSISTVITSRLRTLLKVYNTNPHETFCRCPEFGIRHARQHNMINLSSFCQKTLFQEQISFKSSRWHLFKMYGPCLQEYYWWFVCKCDDGVVSSSIHLSIFRAFFPECTEDLRAGNSSFHSIKAEIAE